MSLEGIELWRPRRERRARRRAARVACLTLVILAPLAGFLLRSPLVMILALAAALAIACALGRPPASSRTWTALLPRRWVPRRPDQRLQSDVGRRASDRTESEPSVPCNPQRPARRFAIGGAPPV